MKLVRLGIAFAAGFGVAAPPRALNGITSAREKALGHAILTAGRGIR